MCLQGYGSFQQPAFEEEYALEHRWNGIDSPAENSADIKGGQFRSDPRLFLQSHEGHAAEQHTLNQERRVANNSNS